MYFIVLEQDPFVRIDIQDTVTTEFPGQPVIVTETPKEVSWDVVSGEEPVVAIVSIRSDEKDSYKSMFDLMEPEVKVVLIGNSPVTEEEGYPPHVFVQRPFDSVMLTKAVKTAISGQP